MWHKYIYIKEFLLAFMVILVAIPDAFAQGTDMGLERRPGAFIGISAGALNSQIISDSDLDIKESGSSGKVSFSGSFDVGYYFSKPIGLRTGIGYSSANVQLTLDSYQSSSNLKDSENESYELRVTASNLTENQSVKILNVPLVVVLNIPLSNIVSIFLEPGISFSIPANCSYNSTGLFTYQGYYPEYNVILENLPNHGFSSNETINTTDDLKIRHSWTDLTLSSGINLAIKRKFQLSAGVEYCRSISDLSGYDSPDSFQLSPIPGQVASLMGASDKVTSKALGFNISLRYLINR